MTQTLKSPQSLPLMSEPAQLVMIVISLSLQIQAEPSLQHTHGGWQHARYFLPLKLKSNAFGFDFQSITEVFKVIEELFYIEHM